MPADEELTEDGFLGGRLTLLQPRNGFRSGVDAVLLAASVPARAGDRVLELGLGAGAASLCLAARVPGLEIAGLEVQGDYARLARRNAERNGVALDVVEGDVAAVPEALRSRQFDHVMMNPPYFRRTAGTPARDEGRDLALAGPQALDAWIAAARRRLRPGGVVTVIQRADRLPDVLAGLGDGFGSAEIKPILPRQARCATLVLVRARKGGRAPFRIHPPLVLHEGAAHVADGESYGPEAQAILRGGAPLDF